MKPGDIFFISSFEFEDGGEPTDKLLIVVDINAEFTLLLRVLTTSQVKVPSEKMLHGCRSEPENGLHYYMFEKDRCIGTSEDGIDFSFSLATFVLFKNNIKDIVIADFLAKYQTRIKHMCYLEEGELKRLAKCIRQNHRVADRSAKRNFPDLFAL